MMVSWSSFFYPIASEDPNVMMDAARYMISGKTLYVDFFEHKGPIIYFIYIFSWLIYPNSFHGLFIVEVIFAWFYYFFTFKTLNIIQKEKIKSNFIITIIACTSSYLCFQFFRGGQIEELCLPFFAYLLMNVADYLVNQNEFQKKTLFFVGLHVGIIFWAKYLCCAFYAVIVIYISIIFIKERKYTALKDIFLYGFCGFATICIAILAYCIGTSSLREMVDVYFIANIFDYTFSTHTSFFQYCIDVLIWAGKSIVHMYTNLIYVLLMIWAMFQYRNHKEDRLYGLCKFVAVAYSVIFFIFVMSGWGWDYYFLPLSVFHAIILLLFLANCSRTKIVIQVCSLCLALYVVTYFANGCGAFRETYHIVSTITSILEENDAVTDFLLVDGLDCGYYYLTGYLPDRYYFACVGARRIEIVRYNMNFAEENGVRFLVVQDKKFDAFAHNRLIQDGYAVAWESDGEIFTKLYELRS